MADTNLARLREEFKNSLVDLKMNSKPMISMLTMLAEEYTVIAPDIVRMVEQRLFEVPSDRKLIMLYLMDSICKNVTGVYVNLFAGNLVNCFAHVFEKGDEKVRASLFKLRQTWNSVFAASKLYQIDIQINKRLDPAWPVTAQAPSEKVPAVAGGSEHVHVNPKFLADKKPNPRQVEAEIANQLLQKQAELLNLQKDRIDVERSSRRTKVEVEPKVRAPKPKEKKRMRVRTPSPIERKRRSPIETRQAKPVDHHVPIETGPLNPINSPNLLTSAPERATPANLLGPALIRADLPVTVPIPPPVAPLIQPFVRMDTPIKPIDPQVFLVGNDVDYRTEFQNLRTVADAHLKSGVLSRADHQELVNEMERALHQQMRQQQIAPQHTTVHNNTAKTPFFNPPARPDEMSMLVDGKLRKLFYLDEHTAIVLMNCPVNALFDELRSRNPRDLDVRQISFEGTPTKVIIDGRDGIMLAFDARYVSFYHKEHEQRIKFGGPAKEIYLNGVTLQAQFGGPPVSCYFLGDGDNVHTLRLVGPPPRVKLSDQPRPDLWMRMLDQLAGRALAFIPNAPPPMLPPSIHTITDTGIPGLSSGSATLSTPVTTLNPEANVNVKDLLSKLMAVGILPASQTKPKSDTESLVKENEENTKPELRENKPRPNRGSNRGTEIDLRKLKHPLKLTSESLKIRRQEVIDMLYSGTQCTNCSLRFDLTCKDTERLAKNKVKYSKHLDWHFRQNRKGRSKPSSTAANLKRSWYYPSSLWMEFREITEEDEEDETNGRLSGADGQVGTNDSVNEKLVPLLKAHSDDHKNICAICYEKFDQIWCEEEEEWKLQNAVIGGETESKFYHPLCLTDMHQSLVEENLPLADLTGKEEDVTRIMKEIKNEIDDTQKMNIDAEIVPEPSLKIKQEPDENQEMDVNSEINIHLETEVKPETEIKLENNVNPEIVVKKEIIDNQKMVDIKEINENHEIVENQEISENQEIFENQEMNVNQGMNENQRMDENQGMDENQEMDENQGTNENQEVNVNQELTTEHESQDAKMNLDINLSLKEKSQEEIKVASPSNEIETNENDSKDFFQKSEFLQTNPESQNEEKEKLSTEEISPVEIKVEIVGLDLQPPTFSSPYCDAKQEESRKVECQSTGTAKPIKLKFNMKEALPDLSISKPTADSSPQPEPEQTKSDTCTELVKPVSPLLSVPSNDACNYFRRGREESALCNIM